MLIVRLHGGLGNQLFQFAYGLYLQTCLKRNDVFFCKLQYRGEIERTFSISMINSKLNFIDAGEFIRFKDARINKVYNFLLGSNYFVEKKSNLTQKYLPKRFPSGSLFLDGYWQKYSIVNYVKDALKAELVLNNSSSMNFLNYRKLILDQPKSVSLHVRRTDFIATEKNRSIFAICGVDYYQKAIDYLKDNLGDSLTFFVFSDDLSWVESNLIFTDKVFFVEGNLDFEDLSLMSLCSHNIIANSTFSWWAAWLNDSKGKIIVCPEVWFKDGGVSDELVPPNWIKLKNQ